MNTSSQTKILFFGALFVLIFLGVILLKNNSAKNSGTVGTSIINSDGKQIIELLARAGYSPASISASANAETILRVKTDSTFDCSSSLTIPKLGIRKNLPPTAVTDILLGTFNPNTKLAGTCSMGMYHFNIAFN